VFAIDASDIAEKAKKIVAQNHMEDIITVIHGKIEDVTLPDDITHVDIIISEWMGYALLYESMLDSVLVARDRFLKPDNGLLAPSQCRIMLALSEASEIYKERISFWNDVYGFNMGPMADHVYDDAIADIVSAESLVSDPECIRDLHLHTLHPGTLNFSSSFKLTATRTCNKVHCFLLYFDAFFTTKRDPVERDKEVKLVREGEAIIAEVWQVGHRDAGGATGHDRKLERRKSSFEAKGKPTSFSTGPLSIPTHWKQTILMLREPIHIEEGGVVSGKFYCKKSEGNSRELDIEVHYSVAVAGKETEAQVPSVVQLFKVR